MPTAIALRSFEHGRRFAKGDTVTFDRLTIDALRKARLVGEDLHAPTQPQQLAITQDPKPEGGESLPALPAAPALPPAIPPPLDAGETQPKTGK